MSTFSGELHSALNNEEKLRKKLLDNDTEISDWFEQEVKKVVLEKQMLELSRTKVKGYIKKSTLMMKLLVKEISTEVSLKT